MDNDLMKSLVDLIDEVVVEIDELKKSDRFSAAEVKLDGPGENLAGKEANGKLGKEEEDEDEKKKKEEAEKKAAMEKGINEEPGMKKEEDEDEEEEEEDEKEPKEEVKKSEQEANDLMKSMVEARVKPLEDKIESLINMVKEFADAPRVQKSTSYKDVAPLTKSVEVEQLNKSTVLEKLFDLKKSGTAVDSADIISAELGSANTLNQIVAKYNIK